MAELTDEEFAAECERGRIVAETEPHARSASFDRATGNLVIDLTNGATYTMPARELQGLEQASDEAIAKIEIGSGYSLHWPQLDADFTVGGLLTGSFGNARYMEAFRQRVRHAA